MIWKVENGTSQPGIELGLKICKALGREPWEVFPLKDSPPSFNRAKQPSPATIPPEFKDLIEKFPEIADSAWKARRPG